MEVQRTDSEGSSFVAFGSEADGEHFALKLSPSTSVGPASGDGAGNEVLEGISVNVPDISAAVAAAVARGAAVVRPQDNVTWGASMVPDEDPYEDGGWPWVLRAVVQEPQSGLSVEFTEIRGKDGDDGEGDKAAVPSLEHCAPRVAHVTLRVVDLDTAERFFTRDLGMTLHRKRSLVPTEPAMSAFLGYCGAELEGTLVELRYGYGRAFGRFKSKAPSQTAVLAVSVPDVAAAVDALARGVQSGGQEGGDGDEGGDDAADLAGWSEALFEAQEDLEVARSKDDKVKVKKLKSRIAELEFKKPTNNRLEGAAAEASKGGEGSWGRARCQVVHPAGAVAGLGDDAAVLAAAEPRVGLHLALVDELDFLKQTLA